MTVFFLRIESPNFFIGTLSLLPRNPDCFSAIKPSALAFFYSTVSGQIEEQPKRYEYHNVATCIATLQRCAQRNDAVFGGQLHGFMVRKGFLNDSPRAVTSLVNMYAKCGLMRRAISVSGGSERDVIAYNAIISGFVLNGLVVTMPVGDNPVVWRSILSSCRLHGNIDLAQVAGKRLYELEPEHCGGYILMSNVYMEAGEYERVLALRNAMKQRNVKKTPGSSWIELKHSHVLYRR